MPAPGLWGTGTEGSKGSVGSHEARDHDNGDN